MGELSPSVDELSDRVDEILGRWLEDISGSIPSDEHAGDLVASYRDLARMILEHGLDVERPPSRLPAGELDRLLGHVARANRRSGQSIASTLTRFSRLTDTVVTLVSSDGSVPEETVAVLRLAANVDTALDFALNRLVRLLEESALRARKERASATAAIMDVLSHELGNRLGAARTATDMLDTGQIELGPDDLHRVSDLVRASLDDALRTVDDVKALITSWGDADSSDVGERRIALPVLMRTVVDELQPSASEAGVRLEMPAVPPDVSVDTARLRLILFNLVSNGIKYHDPEERDPWVRLMADRTDDGRLRIRVADNGIGIAPEDQEDIFLYRVRVENGVKGSGLGLAIAREAVDQLGGELTLESRPGEGSEFTVLLQPSDAGAQADSEASSG